MTALLTTGSTMVADFLVAFGSSVDRAVDRRDPSSTSSESRVGSSVVRVDDPGPRWRGFPCESVVREGWTLWALGEPSPNPRRDTFWDREGPSVSRLNGRFALLAWHDRTRCWHAWTDRFGTIHLYYGRFKDGAALGTFHPGVVSAGSRRDLDWAGLTSFMGFGFLAQDRTHHSDVKILRPARHCVFDESGELVADGRYWDWWHEPDRVRTYGETVSAFSDVLGEVVAEQVNSADIGVPVSGGLDSRSVVAALPEGSHPWSFSYGYLTDRMETGIARQVADRRQLPFDSFSVTPYLFRNLDLVMSSVEGFQDVTQCRQASALDELRPRVDRVLAAHWGDVWCDDAGFLEDGLSTAAIADGMLSKMGKPGSYWLLDKLCRPHLEEDPQEVLRSMVRDELSTVEHIEDRDFRAKAFKTDQWSFRWTLASLRMYQPAAFPRLPFYDSRLVDLICTIPSVMMAERQLQLDFLRWFAPDLASVSWQETGTGLFHVDSHWRRSSRRVLNKAKRMATRSTTIQRNWEVQFLSTEGRASLEGSLTSPGLRLHDLMAAADVRSALDSLHETRSREWGYVVSMLLTFSEWLERYG